jgi:hypothetical protein
MELDEHITRLFQTGIDRHKRKTKDCFADELEDLRDRVLAIIALEALKTKVNL